MFKPPFFSIVIPTYGRSTQLTKCLDSITKLDYPRTSFEVVVVNDGGVISNEALLAEFKNRLDLTLLSQSHAGPATVIRERTRQGYDAVAACWDDPELREARWLKAGIFSLPLFYGMKVVLDLKRVCIGRKDLDLALWQVIVAFPLFAFFRLLDATGMLRALVVGKNETAWGGMLVKRRSS